MYELHTLGATDLRDAGGREVATLLRQPKRFALLAWLAIERPDRFVRRDTLLTLFWPDLDQEHARAALRRALHFLRKALDDDTIVNRGDEEVGLAPGTVWCDATAFRAALASGDHGRALRLYQGPLLEGFYVAGAPAVEDWLDRERHRLHDAATAAGWHQAGAWRQPDPGRAPPTPAGEPDPGLLAVAPFTVHGSPELAFLGEGIVDLLAAKLEGAGHLRVVEPRQAIAAARGLPDAARFAALLGAGGSVTGTIVGLAGRIEVTAALHAGDGAILARGEGRAESESGLFELVDELARQLLAGRLGGTAGTMARLAARTTDSLPALKAWLEGERQFRLARHLEASESFRRATEHDPGFGLAWYRLAGSLAACALIEPAREASTRAYRLREPLSDHDRALLEAQHAWIQGNSGEAERRYAALVTAFPESLEGWFLLGDVQVHSNPYRGKTMALAREAFERALALDPDHQGALAQLARIAALEGRLADLGRLVDRALALSPEGDQALGLRALRAFTTGALVEGLAVAAQLNRSRGVVIARAFSDVVLYGGNVAGAEKLGGMLFSRVRSEEGRAIGHITLAHLAVAQGRGAEGFSRLDEAAALAPEWAVECRALLATVPGLGCPAERVTALREELERWDPASATPAVAPPLSFHNDVHAHFRSFLLGMLAAQAGRPEDVALHADALAELPVPPGAEAAVHHLVRGLGARLLEARGREAEALALLEQPRPDVWFQYAVASPFFSRAFERFLRADLLARAGRWAEAMRWWQAIAERSPFELPWQAPALRRMADGWRTLGDADRAAECEDRAARLWAGGPQW